MSELKEVYQYRLDEQRMILEYLRYHAEKAGDDSAVRDILDRVVADIESYEHRKDLYRGS